MRSTSFLLGVLLPRVLDPDPGSQEGTGRSQLKVQSLEKSHRGQLQPGPARKLLSSEFHCRILCTPSSHLASALFSICCSKVTGERNSQELPSAADPGEPPKKSPTGVGVVENRHCLQPFPDHNTSYSTAGDRWPQERRFQIPMPSDFFF